MSSQLERLARPFPDRLIHTNPSGGGSYVKHSVVTEKLLAIVGPFDFELVKEIRGHVEAVEPNAQGKSARAKRGSPALSEAVVGAVCRLSCTVDGRPTRVEEVGDCESPHNWPHDGARLKDAMSDALKRCAMRLGVTLHLWSGPEFSLYDQLQKSSPLESSGESTRDTANAGPVSSPIVAGPATSKARIQTLVAHAASLRSEGVDVDAVQREWNLPDIAKCDEKQLALWGEMLHDIESKLAAPFEKAPA